MLSRSSLSAAGSCPHGAGSLPQTTRGVPRSRLARANFELADMDVGLIAQCPLRRSTKGSNGSSTEVRSPNQSARKVPLAVLAYRPDADCQRQSLIRSKADTRVPFGRSGNRVDLHK